MAGILKENKVAPLNDLAKKYISNAMELVFAPENKDNFLKMLQSSLQDSNKTGDAIADTILLLSQQLDSVAQSEGIQVDHEVRFAALPYLIDIVIQVAEGYDLIPQITEKDISLLASTVVIKYIESAIQNGTLTREEMASLGNQLKQEGARQQASTPSEEEMMNEEESTQDDSMEEGEE